MRTALAITGPTASGKTALSVGLARSLGCEIISCDSMQIYRGMDIGTAKATGAEQALVPHHLIDIISPLESYSTEAYRADALAAADDIASRGLFPLFVGGTGLYIDSLMRAPMPEVPRSTARVSELGPASVSEEERDALWQRLLAVDPESAALIHKNNVRRVLRALEIYDTTGRPKSYFDRLSRTESPDIKVGMMTLDIHKRDTLYERVDERVDIMMREGLLSEVEGLMSSGMLREDTTAAQAIGYKELFKYIKGECTLAEAVEEIKLASRRYAKRQLTWFRHEEGAYRLWLDGEDGTPRGADSILSEALEFSNEFIKKYKYTEG